MDEILEKMLTVFGGKKTENGIIVHCPAHDDSNPSLSINIGEDRKLLVHCFAGCPQEAVIEALKTRNLWPTNSKEIKPRQKRLTDTYDYLGPDGNLLFQVCRYEPKTFRQRRPDGNGGWIWSIKNLEPVPYRLPEVLKTPLVFIVEGEKDVNKLFGIGLVATCNAQGAGNWKDSYNKYFHDKDVVIIPDNDPPGEKHGRQIAKSLHHIVKSLRILRLPGLPEKGDVSDWLNAKGNKDRMLELVEKCQIWDPDTDYSSPSRSLILSDWQASTAFTGEPKKREYLVDRIFPLGQVSLVGAAGGVGKSGSLLALAVAVARGSRNDF